MNQNETYTPLLVQLCVGLAICVLLSGCKQQVSERDMPVSHWLDSTELCARETAAAILHSGRPFPNEVWTDEKGQISEEAKVNLREYDLWIADRLYVMPGIWGASRPWIHYPKNHPLKYRHISPGTVEGILKIGRQKFRDDRIGGTLLGTFDCRINLPSSMWIENVADYAPTEDDLIKKISEKFRSKKDFESLSINSLPKINMKEIGYRAADGSTSYAYVSSAYKQMIGSNLPQLKAIECSPRQAIGSPRTNRYDPDGDFDTTSSLCAGWIWLGPGLHVRFSVYQHYLPFIPQIHAKLIEDLDKARRQ
ncbi:MAG: hypothetical protein ACK4F6_04015 [Hylemonella sp.]